MSWLQSFAISQSGMNAERLRVDIAAMNIANANVAATPGFGQVQALKVVTQPAAAHFNQVYANQLDGVAMNGVLSRVVAQETAPRQVHEPAHPLANERGYVEYPGVNALTEMLTLTTAIRAYEANVVAFNAAKTMAVRALDIGGQG